MDSAEYEGAVGRRLEDGGIRLEDEDNPDAWIEVDYRDGWMGRKVLNTEDEDEYAEMVEPYLLKCRACHRFMSSIRWGVETDGEYHHRCPHCEMTFELAIPKAFDRMFGDPDIPRCKDCGNRIEHEGPMGYGVRCSPCTLEKMPR